MGIRKKIEINKKRLALLAVFANVLSNKAPVKAVKAMVVIIVKKPFGKLSSLPSISKKILSLTKVVFEPNLTRVGTPIKVNQNITVDQYENSPLGSLIPEIANVIENPTLIPIQKTKFQNLFFVSHLLFIIAGFAALITGEVGRVVLDTFSGAASFVSAFSAAIYWFLYFTVPNFVKSFMSSCCNYWFKLYSFIVPKLECILKLIMQFVLAFTLCFQISNTMATPVKETVAEDVRALITKAERKYKIPFGLLTAIAKVESDMRSFAINVGGRSIFAASLAEATSAAKREIDAGKTNIDLGVMQLNWRWHGDQFSSLEEMLNPEKNIAYSARHLKQLYNQHGNWQKAIRYYHSAKPEYNRKYSRKVTMIWLASN